MNTNGVRDLEGNGRDATRRILEVTLREGEPICVVRSPPGAGKTHLVESCVAVATELAKLRVAVVAPTAEQTYALIRRLTGNFDSVTQFWELVYYYSFSFLINDTNFFWHR